MKIWFLLFASIIVKNLYAYDPLASTDGKLEAKFDKYKVKEVYKGEIKIPKSYKKDEEGLYRDELGKFVSNQQQFYVNFAGKYMIVTHSCGTSCYYRTVEDLSGGVTVKIEGIEKFDNTEANYTDVENVVYAWGKPSSKPVQKQPEIVKENKKLSKTSEFSLLDGL